MKHIMVDLETMGSTPGCAILSIGAVYFDPATKQLGKEFYTNVELVSSLKHGLKIEAATLYWWLEQSDKSRLALLEKRNDLSHALYNFEKFIESNKSECFIWSHGASFDLAVLHCAYTAAQYIVPWNFRNERDTRTILDITIMEMGKSQLAHNALEDAKHQARVIMVALNKLGIGND